MGSKVQNQILRFGLVWLLMNVMVFVGWPSRPSKIEHDGLEGHPPNAIHVYRMARIAASSSTSASSGLSAESRMTG